jgi:hypothetical protein
VALSRARRVLRLAACCLNSSTFLDILTIDFTRCLLNAMAKRPRIHIVIRRGSTLAMLILAFQAFQVDLAAIALGASSMAVAIHISQSTTSSLHEDIRTLVEEFDDIQRVLEAKHSLTTPDIHGKFRRLPIADAGNMRGVEPQAIDVDQ